MTGLTLKGGGVEVGVGDGVAGGVLSTWNKSK